MEPETDLDDLDDDLEEALAKGKGPKIARAVLATLGGVPYAGGLFGAAAGAWSEAEQDHVNRIFAQWLRFQREEIEEMAKTLAEVLMRLDPKDDKVRERLESPGYHSLVKKCFRDWSAAESEEKRVLLRNLLANAASSAIASDDIVRLFIDWIAHYSEIHFKVLALVYKNPGMTRYDMWQEIHGDEVREDSAEADLFKLVVQDLSMGHVMRQARDTDHAGRFMRSRTRTKRGPYMQSAFDEKKQYVLTELGKQFVHYAMTEIVPKIGNADL
ncbi:MAG: hypothetical protein AAF682_00145 [Planctomycetota bacterium]